MKYINTQNSLQPMPAGVSANISNNINSTSTYNSDFENFSFSNTLVSTSSSDLSPVIASETKQSSTMTIWLWTIFIILVTVIVILGLRKLKK
jgi:hypothetical protein